MKVYKADEIYSDFIRGWVIGNFEPSIIKTEHCELGILRHRRGEYWPRHYHKMATEYNYLAKGKMNVNGVIINEGDIFIIDKNEVSEPEFLEDCIVVVLKIPSVKGDKYEI